MSTHSGAAPGRPRNPSVTRTIIISNESKTVFDADVRSAVAALQKQVDHDFAPAYSGLRADLKAWSFTNGPVPAGTEVIHILDTTDQADALGYHELSPAGIPEGFVF